MDPDVERVTEIITKYTETFTDSELQHILVLLGKHNDILKANPRLKQQSAYVMPWDDPLMQNYVNEHWQATAQAAMPVQYTSAYQALQQAQPQLPMPDIPEKVVYIGKRKYVLFHSISETKPTPNFIDRQEAKNKDTVFHYMQYDQYGQSHHYVMKPTTGNIVVLYGAAAKGACGPDYDMIVSYIVHPETIVDTNSNGTATESANNETDNTDTVLAAAMQAITTNPTPTPKLVLPKLKK